MDVPDKDRILFKWCHHFHGGEKLNSKKLLRVQYMCHRNCSILLCLLWNSFLKFSVWWLQFLWHENELTVNKISGTPGHARFSLVQICRCCRPVAADKLMLSPNWLLLIFTFFILTPTYYTFLESLWPEEFNKIVFNMF